MEPHGQLGNDSERALRSNEQAGQIIAGCRLAGPPRGPNDPAIGEHHGHCQDILAHRSVSDRIGSRGTRRSHPAERGIGTGVDWKKETGIAQMFVQLFACDTRFDGGVEVFRVDAQDTVHLRHVDAYAAGQCGYVPLEGCPGAERNDRRLIFGAQLDDRRHLIGAVGECDGIGGMRNMVGFVFAVMRADRCRSGKPSTEQLA